MNGKTEVQKYLESLPIGERKILVAMRRQILRVAPGMSERLSRGVPFFYYLGKRAVGFRSSKNHLSFFIMEGNVLKSLRNQLSGFDNSSTVVRFTAENPLPETLIQKLVRARISEIKNDLRV